MFTDFCLSYVLIVIINKFLQQTYILGDQWRANPVWCHTKLMSNSLKDQEKALKCFSMNIYKKDGNDQNLMFCAYLSIKTKSLTWRNISFFFFFWSFKTFCISFLCLLICNDVLSLGVTHHFCVINYSLQHQTVKIPSFTLIVTFVFICFAASQVKSSTFSFLFHKLFITIFNCQNMVTANSCHILEKEINNFKSTNICTGWPKKKLTLVWLYVW